MFLVITSLKTPKKKIKFIQLIKSEGKIKQ